MGNDSYFMSFQISSDYVLGLQYRNLNRDMVGNMDT